jgi:hypothetical protein
VFGEKKPDFLCPVCASELLGIYSKMSFLMANPFILAGLEWLAEDGKKMGKAMSKSALEHYKNIEKELNDFWANT